MTATPTRIARPAGAAELGGSSEVVAPPGVRLRINRCWRRPVDWVAEHAGTVAGLTCRWLRRTGRRVLASVGSPGRLLLLAWLVGVLTVGGARIAFGDGIFAHPPYADGQQTLYDAHGPFAYSLTVQPDEDANSGLGLTAVLYQIVGVVNSVLLWVGLVPLYGALTLLEWFLNLTLYQDAAGQLDAAVQAVAGEVFWPLISATVAVGAVISFGRWQAEGRSWLTDLGWIIAATVLAVTFVSKPSQVLLEVDGARQQLAAAVVTGTTAYTAESGGSVTGYPHPTLTGPAEQVAARNLVDGLWDSFGATPWCLAEFHDLDICRKYGFHALAQDATWQQWTATMAANNQVTEFGTWQNWVRGMDLGRLGYALILVMMALPAAGLTGALVVAGLSAVVGLLAMILLGVLALVTWPIPGWFRQFGTRWWAAILGAELQALFITAILAAVMVVSRIIGAHVGQYGFFIVALLNIVLLLWAVKTRGWIDTMTMTGGGGRGGGGMLGYLALWGAARLGRAAWGGAKGLAKAPWRTGSRIGTLAGNAADAYRSIPTFLRTPNPARPGQPLRQLNSRRIPDLDPGPHQLTARAAVGIAAGPHSTEPGGSSSGEVVRRPIGDLMPTNQPRGTTAGAGPVVRELPAGYIRSPQPRPAPGGELGDGGAAASHRRPQLNPGYIRHPAPPRTAGELGDGGPTASHRRRQLNPGYIRHPAPPPSAGALGDGGAAHRARHHQLPPAPKADRRPGGEIDQVFDVAATPPGRHSNGQIRSAGRPIVQPAARPATSPSPRPAQVADHSLREPTVIDAPASLAPRRRRLRDRLLRRTPPLDDGPTSGAGRG